MQLFHFSFTTSVLRLIALSRIYYHSSIYTTMIYMQVYIHDVGTWLYPDGQYRLNDTSFVGPTLGVNIDAIYK